MELKTNLKSTITITDTLWQISLSDTFCSPIICKIHMYITPATAKRIITYEILYTLSSEKFDFKLGMKTIPLNKKSRKNISRHLWIWPLRKVV